MNTSPSHGPGTPRCAQRGLETVTLFNMPMNNLNLQETLEAIGRHVDANEQGFVVTPNVDHAVEFDENPDFRQAYYDAAMVLVDGMYIVWAGRLFGKPIKAFDKYGDWSVSLGYRHVESDAVIDGLADSVFGGGGSNMEGYSLNAAMALTKRTWMRLGYFSANQIAGPVLQTDVFLLDFTAKF